MEHRAFPRLLLRLLLLRRPADKVACVSIVRLCRHAQRYFLSVNPKQPLATATHGVDGTPMVQLGRGKAAEGGRQRGDPGGGGDRT